MHPTIHVAIIDDHTLFRSGLRALLEHWGFKIVLEADNGLDLMEKLGKIGKNQLPEVAVLDINMPQMNGLEAAKLLNTQYPQIGILMCTMTSSPRMVSDAMAAGAIGYLVKDAMPDEIKTGIESVYRKQPFFSKNAMASAAKALVETVQLHDKITKSALTAKELEILHLICQANSTSDIAQKLFLSPRTVDGYKAALMSKLEVQSMVGLVIVAIKEGLYKMES